MQDDGNKKIGDEEDLYGGTSQPIILEKQVTLTLEFRMAFHEITPETAVEKRPAHSREEVLGDEWMMGWVERQAKILHALLEDEEALCQFIACGVIDLMVAGDGRLLRKGLKVETEEEALRPLVEGFGGEVAEYYSEVWGGGRLRGEHRAAVGEHAGQAGEGEWAGDACGGGERSGRQGV